MALGVKPYVVNGAWDNLSYIEPDGKVRQSGLSEGLRIQFRKMVHEGVWGDVTIKPDRPAR